MEDFAIVMIAMTYKKTAFFPPVVVVDGKYLLAKNGSALSMTEWSMPSSETFTCFQVSIQTICY